MIASKTFFNGGFNDSQPVDQRRREIRGGSDCLFFIEVIAQLANVVKFVEELNKF
ncbi:hypothetical protein DesyoDRAFT_1932 [Desulfosporosinus youngiae DSM 17734]|uniref:Uncharacterized protein n=1 Tax=Desulfosporosinus youngiae DSM 17734 TaxID=768710 RepID=H5XUM4_9FIRM|nr:hypothetical protein DesyoDRAFT_1932 [Desulfosporosinus youngiae DSM 17734]